MLENNNRYIYIDAIRVIACLAVVILHVSATNTYNVECNTPSWNVFMFYEGLVNWAVPEFVLISGLLTLAKNNKLKKNINKIIHIIIIFFVWSAVYVTWEYILAKSKNIDYGKTFYARQLIEGHYHLWYLIMFCGLCIVMPIVRQIVLSRHVTLYFIAISFILNFLVPTIRDFVEYNIEGGISNIINSLKLSLVNVSIDLNIYLTKGYVFYYVVGYFLVYYCEGIWKRKNVGLFLFSIGSVLEIAMLLSANNKDAAMSFLQFYQINILLQTIGLFMILRGTRVAMLKYIAKIAPYTLGIYLIHPLIIEILQEINITTLSFEPLISVPIISIFVFVLSFVIVYLLKKIKILNYTITI